MLKPQHETKDATTNCYILYLSYISLLIYYMLFNILLYITILGYVKLNPIYITGYIHSYLSGVLGLVLQKICPQPSGPPRNSVFGTMVDPA